MHLFRQIEKTLTKLVFKQSFKLSNAYLNKSIFRLLSYTPSHYDNERDPAPIFFKKDIQSLLKSLTRVDLNKVYKKRKLGENKLELPTYKFMTDEQLQEIVAKAKTRSDEILHMPPVVQLRKADDHVYIEDIALKGLDTTNIIFTDITFGIKDRDRLIVVREPNGTLRNATWEERDRMNEVYFPKQFRKLKNPKMFNDEYLEDLLKREEYEFILNRACIQFEPDNPDYQRITSITYQHLNDNHNFESLRSTRHFGPLVFYLTWFKNVDNLLLDLIETAHIEEVNQLLRVYEIIHNVEFNVSDLDSLESLSRYIEQMSQKKGSLELAVKAYKDLITQRNKLQKEINSAHGLM